ncbi:MAG: hypothetical protein EP311_00140 [Cytophagales bacterium]|nr:MAG: hypothetical protein EP311_00140 [Cytophagales bacterium]
MKAFKGGIGSIFQLMFSLLGLFLLYSCLRIEEPKEISEEETFWVYGYPIVSRPGAMPTTSKYAISWGEELNYDYSTWALIPMQIEGFSLKPHFFQKLKVEKTTEIKTGEMIRKLIQVLEEEKDNFELIEGVWRVNRYKNEDLPNLNFPDGQIIIIHSFPRVAFSTDGCNQIELPIKKVGPDQIDSFGIALSTQIACSFQQIVPAYPGLTHKFKREGKMLTFYSQEEGEISVWKKLD